MKNSRIQRRQFLKNSLLSGVGTASAAGVLNSLTISQALAQSSSPYKALVCVFLYGGNDSFNMVVPRSTPEYEQYEQARQSLAVEQNALLPINALSTGSVQYGLHPGMEAVQGLFNQGRVAVQANVGALIEPTNRTSYLQGSVEIPDRLFSHNDQQDFWQGLQAGGQVPIGWAGQMAEIIEGQNQTANVPMNISLSGSNLLQFSSSGLPYNVSPNGVINLLGASGGNDAQAQRRAQAYQALLTSSQSNLFSQEFADRRITAAQLAGEVGSALDAVPALSTSFPGGKLGPALQMVAQLIAARNTLGMSRQIFFVGFGGWDTHGDQLTEHPALLAELSNGLGAFYAATEELNVQNDVTTFTAADFGRTLTSNGDGSDHGWGGHQLVMGGAVQGQSIYGVMPELELDGPLDSGRGRIIPTTAVDQYGATLARWFGVAESDLSSVFPNLSNFASSNIGFMG